MCFSPGATWANRGKSHLPAVGIDFGAHSVCLALWKNDRFEIIPNEFGKRQTPSLVLPKISEANVSLTVGESIQNHQSALSEVKVFLGRDLEDTYVREKRCREPTLQLKAGSDASSELEIIVNDPGSQSTIQLAPSELTRALFQKLFSLMESRLGPLCPPPPVGIAIPSRYTHTQRQLIQTAAQAAGFTQVKLVSEPVAALHADGLHLVQGYDLRKVLVVDLGARRLTTTLLTVDTDGLTEEVLSKVSNSIGGELFTESIVEHALRECHRQHPGKSFSDLKGNTRLYNRLRRGCEGLKHRLSTSFNASITLDGWLDGEDFHLPVSRARFEALNQTPFREFPEMVRGVLTESATSLQDLSKVVLVGGSMRIPRIQAMLRSLLGDTVCCDLNADEVVAIGAARFAHNSVHGKESTPSDFAGGSPDLAILSVGVASASGLMVPLIKRCTFFPVRRSLPFSVAAAAAAVSAGESGGGGGMCNGVTVDLYEGERPLARDCHFLNRFPLRFPFALPLSAVLIDVSLEVDCNGFLTIEATERITGATTTKQYLPSKVARFSEHEIVQHILTAESMLEADQRLEKCMGAEESLTALLCDLSIAHGAVEELSDGNRGLVVETVRETQQWLSGTSRPLEELEARENALREFLSVVGLDSISPKKKPSALPAIQLKTLPLSANRE